MKPLIALFFLYFSVGTFAQNCQLNTSVAKKDFALHIPNQKLKSSTTNLFTVSVKAPTKGAHIKKSTMITCNNWIPSGASVLEIQIKSIKNLPKGLSWSSSFTDNRLPGGESGCVFLKGKPEQKGRFKLDVSATGKGKFLGITKTIECEISGIVIEVE